MSTERASVWMASPEYLGRTFKWWVYQDTGSLQFAPGVIRFRGRSSELSLPTVVDVSLVRQPIPWLTILSGIGLPALIISLGLFSTLNWADPLTIGVFLAISVFFFLAAGPVQWVKVEFRDEEGAPGIAYFLDGAGASRFVGGTRKLSAEIRKTVFPTEA